MDNLWKLSVGALTHQRNTWLHCWLEDICVNGLKDQCEPWTKFECICAKRCSGASQLWECRLPPVRETVNLMHKAVHLPPSSQIKSQIRIYHCHTQRYWLT